MRFFNIHSVAKFTQKIEGGPFGDFEIFAKTTKMRKSHSAEKSERWDALEFFNSRSVAKYGKN